MNAGAEEIFKNISTISHVAKESAGASETMTAATSQLGQQPVRLQQLAARFKVSSG